MLDMKILFIAVFLMNPNLYAKDYCPANSESDLISQLAKDLEASCDWSIKELAEESILKKCEKANLHDRSISIKHKRGKKKIIFIKKTDHYDAKAPNIECKHSKAYEDKLKKKIALLEREAYAVDKMAKVPAKRKASVKSEKRLWSCQVPNYIRTYRIVDDNEKQTMETAYNTTCTPYTHKK